MGAAGSEIPRHTFGSAASSYQESRRSSGEMRVTEEAGAAADDSETYSVVTSWRWPTGCSGAWPRPKTWSRRRGCDGTGGPCRGRRPAATSSGVTTRLALDRASPQGGREEYNGPWLPEPVAAVRIPPRCRGCRVGFAGPTGRARDVSPLERAVFCCGRRSRTPTPRSPGSSTGASPVRQVSHRARNTSMSDATVRHRRGDEPPGDRAVPRGLRDRRPRCAARGAGPDVVLIGDGGDEAKAPRRPVVGATRRPASSWRSGLRSGAPVCASC